jgi:5-hydroxyisourate hydrolase
MSGITTHVLDTARGRPAAGMRVALEAKAGDGWDAVGGGTTDADGRVPGLVAEGRLRAGVHRLHFHTGDWFDAEGVKGFYPLVTVVCVVEDPEAHYHVPLLLSPYGYSTYRGS